jgi:hypothetical protein
MDIPEHQLIPLGRIVRLQIQRSSLKLGEKPNRWYDPAPLLAVDRLTLTPDGATITGADGVEVLDVHHAQHPATRNSGGVNDLSVGFTGHYAAMRGRFGSHLADGLAGENILVERPGFTSLAEVAGGLAVRRAAGGWVRLGEVRVAAPCVEFSRYSSRSADAETVKATLQFLDAGVRGFYCTYAAAPATLAVGDELYALSA